MGNHCSISPRNSTYFESTDTPNHPHSFSIMTSRDTRSTGVGGANGTELSRWYMQYTQGTKSRAFELLESSSNNRVESILLIFNDSACNFAHCGVKIERDRAGGLRGAVDSIRYTGSVNQKNHQFSSTRNTIGWSIETTIFTYGCSLREGLLVMEKKKRITDESFYKVTVAHCYVTKNVGVSAVVKIHGDKGDGFDIEVERPAEHPSSDLRMVLVETCRSRAWVPTACSHCVRTAAPGKRKQVKEFLNRQIFIGWKIVTGNQNLTGLINNTGSIQGNRNGAIN